MKAEHVNAGVVNMADKMTIYGNQYGTVAADEGARQAVRDLRTALAAAPLDRATRTKASAQAAEIDAAMRTEQPDKSRIAGMLQRLTSLLGAAGSLASAGAPFIGPLHALAAWLGALGAPVLRLLPV
jgi:hypothetical protein